jgi:hypothetical protein
MKRKLYFTLGFSLFAMAGSSLAAPVLQDGFEDPPTLGSTDGTGDFDPADNNNPHGTAANGPVIEATPEGVQVRTVAVAPGPAEGSQYLRITEGDHYKPFFSPTIGNSQDFTVTFWVYNTAAIGLNLQIGRINTDTGPNIGFSNMRWEGGQISRFMHGSEGPSGWADITSFTSGQWDHIGLEYEASGTLLGTFNLYINNFDTPVAENLLVNNSLFSPPLNNVFFGTRTGAGEIYIDGIDVFEGPMPEPTTVDSTVVEVDGVFGLQFMSEVSRVYSLEFTTSLAGSAYQSTGARLEGNGGIMEMFDPTGGSDIRTYRVVIE